jgi:hypothetical protein
LRRRAIDSVPFLSLVTGKASRFWSAPRFSDVQAICDTIKRGRRIVLNID